MISTTTHLIAWTLLHSLWQFAAAWGFNAVLQRVLRATAARVRYAVACTMTLAGVLAVAITATVLEANPSAVGRPTITNGLFDLVHIERPWAASVAALDLFQWIAPGAVAAWAALAINKLRFAASGLAGLASTRDRLLFVRDVDLPPYWHRLAAHLAPGQVVKLAESYDVLGPAMFGWIKPVVVVPLGFLSGNSPLMVEAIIAHELAHVGRRDYLANIVQVVLEGVFWFNPPFNALSMSVRVLREKCCDEAAVRGASTSPEAYARIMLALNDYQQSFLAMGARGVPLGDRLLDLMSPRRPSTATLLARIAGVSVLMLGSLGFTSKTVTNVVAEQATTIEVLAKPLTAQVYELLGNERENALFAPAVAQAVQQVKAKSFNEHQARELARIASLGVRRDVLMEASKQSFGAARLVPLAGARWSGGGSRDWDQLSMLLLDFAKRATRPGDQRAISRTSLAIASQDRFGGPGAVQMILRDPAFCRLAGIDPSEQTRLLGAVAAESSYAAKVALRIEGWAKHQPVDIPRDMQAAAASASWIQWRIANVILEMRRDGPTRAEALEASARASKDLGLCVALLERSRR